MTTSEIKLCIWKHYAVELMHLVIMLIVLLPNINGPTNLVRRLFWESMVLYASPVWVEAPKMTKNKKNIKKGTKIGHNEDVNSL